MPHAREVFERFLEGEAPEAGGVWRDVTWELDAAASRKKASIRYLLILALFVCGLIALGWYLLEATPGI